MKSKLITFILGTRPEAIKLAPLIKYMSSEGSFRVRVILSGQHKDMVKKIFSLFKIKYDLDLAIMVKEQTIVHITNKTISGITDDLIKTRPQLVIVQGDTTTAFAGALAAFYQKIPIAHVEAGLRTNEIYDPFPEEINRRLISQLSHLHFAPTSLAKENCIKSGILGEVHITGNTVIDALQYIKQEANPPLIESIKWDEDFIVLATTHRRENLGNNLADIANGLNKILEISPKIKIILPMHPNPKIRKVLKKILGEKSHIFLMEPFEYEDIIPILARVDLVITDSGGLQEEAPAFGKPVLILRETTERPEALIAGTAKLVGTNSKIIFEEANLLLSHKEKYNKMAKSVNPFGDGKASERIYGECMRFLKNE